jgi:hypothetical protein
MTHFRHAAIAAALLADVGTASAQTTVITREPVETRTLVTMQPLELTPVQRQTIYRTIVRQPVETVQPTVEYRVGTRVPQARGFIRCRAMSSSRCRRSELTNTRG